MLNWIRSVANYCSKIFAWDKKSKTTATFRKDNKASEGGSILKWIIGIGVIVALYMMFGSGTPPKQTSTPVQSTYSTNAPASNVAQPSAKQGNQELAFEIPPVERDNILNLPQLRWYVREKIRIETMRNLASNNRAIGEFNAMVDNFNSRCGNSVINKGFWHVLKQILML